MKNLENIYCDGNSPFHRFTPPLKIIGNFILVFSISFLTNPVLIFSIMFIILILITLSKINIINYFKHVKSLLYLFLIMSFLLIISSGGGIFFKIELICFTINFYKSGLDLSILIFLRGLCIFSFFYLLLSTTKITDMLYSMVALHIPQNIGLIFLFTYRYIFRYFFEMEKMKKAIILKGIGKRKGKLLIIGELYANLLIRSYEDTDRIYKAMVLKGLLEKKVKTIKFKISSYDIILFCLIIFISLFYLILDKSGIVCK